MTLTEKIEALTPAQQEKLEALKDSTEFDAFLLETGLELTDAEKAEVTSLIESGKLPLSDDELSDVAGGNWRGKERAVIPKWKML